MRLLLAALSAASGLLVNVSHADPAPPTSFSEQAARQAAIYNSVGEKTPEGYVVGRSLLSYSVMLPSEFKQSLAALGPRDRWLDVGAGEGRAAVDYCTSQYDVMLEPYKGSGKKAQVVAMSIEDRRTREWHDAVASLSDNQLKYVFGKPFREYSSDELGKFQLITDVLGGFSYTRYMSGFMEKALGLLTVNGSLYTVLQDVQSEQGTNRPHYAGSPYLTEIVNADGAPMSVCSWLKSIGCVQVTCELNMNSTPPIELYRVRKVCDDVRVPALVPLHFEAGTPPERRYRLAPAVAEPVKALSASR